MLARTLVLRLLAASLAMWWAVMAVAVLVDYHPGGSLDGIVTGAAFLPAVVAGVAVVWPPRPADTRTTVAVVWLAIASLLILTPWLGLLRDTLGRGAALLPSFESAFAGLLALAGTCLFTGLGIAGRSHLSGLRARSGIAAGTALLLVTAGGLGGAAVANERAHRAVPVADSPFGPSDGRLPLPGCTEVPAEAPFATVGFTASSSVDGVTVGELGLVGRRSGEAERWEADRRTPWAPAHLGSVRIGQEMWLREGGAGWRSTPPDVFGPAPVGMLDRAVRELVASPGGRTGAEDLGIELVDDVRARHCRFLVSGPMAIDGFVPLRWLVADGAPDPAIVDFWRGELDYWLFADRQIGRAHVTVYGYPPAHWPRTGIGATLTATMDVMQRTEEPLTIEPPFP